VAQKNRKGNKKRANINLPFTPTGTVDRGGVDDGGERVKRVGRKAKTKKKKTCQG